jgi:MFS family permease
MVSTIGTALEYYDFIIYGIAAALVASKVFFPGNDPMIAMLLSLGVFGVGFLARPNSIPLGRRADPHRSILPVRHRRDG